jgi:stage II sporulation protein M
MFKLSQILLSPKKAERHPIEILLVGFFYASLSLVLSYWIFPEYSSLVMVFLTVISCLYLIESLIIMEENKEDDYSSEYNTLRRHMKTIYFLIMLFLGFLLAFTFWTLILPEHLSVQIFSSQSQSIEQIKSLTGSSISQTNDFQTILLNNLRVLLLSLVLALFYGAGAIFVLAWNASIMGFAIGELTKNTLGLIALPHSFLRYFLHGIPEMAAYFLAALAGGIVFISLVRGDLKKGKAKRILYDFIILVALSMIILIIAAFIESFVSPLI